MTPTKAYFKELIFFVEHYAHPEVTEQRSVETFIDVEARERLNSLRAELLNVSKGNFSAETMEKILGKARLSKYGSYEEWAKLMLRWIAGYKH